MKRVVVLIIVACLTRTAAGDERAGASRAHNRFRKDRRGPSIVSVSGSQLLVQKRRRDGALAPPAPYVVRGVAWSPASPGTDPAGLTSASVRRREFGLWYTADVPLLDAMNVNTVRMFIDPGVDGELGPIGWSVLDELYQSGIMVIMTVDDGVNDLDRVQGAVTYYKDHPAVLMWSLGSEWNINCYYQVEDCVGAAVAAAAEATESAAALIKCLDPNHPVASSYGDIDIDAPGKRLGDTAHYVNDVCANVDVWSLNIYRGRTFGDLFERWGSITSKPMFLGEFGVDAYSERMGGVDEGTQAEWNVCLWNDIARHLSSDNPGAVAVGGTLFEWNDEWWKVLPAGSQEEGGWGSCAFPDGTGNEEYFGILDIDRGPRKVYERLRYAFHPLYTPPPPTIMLKLVSEGSSVPGWPDGGFVEFSRDGCGCFAEGGGGGARGFNVVVIDSVTGSVIGPCHNFDTWATRHTGAAMNSMMEFINAIPDGQVVAIAVADDAGLNVDNACDRYAYSWVENGLLLLESLGSTRIRNYCFRDSWAMIAIKGTGQSCGEGLGKEVLATVEVLWNTASACCIAPFENACTFVGSHDSDLDVDWNDWRFFAACLGGPTTTSAPECHAADLNVDGWVDLRDVQLFARVFTGERSCGVASAGIR